MSELPPGEPSDTATAADRGWRKAAVRETRRAPLCTGFIAVACNGLTIKEYLALRPKTVLAEEAAACP
jgi:hypothetical protein